MLSGSKSPAFSDSIEAHLWLERYLRTKHGIAFSSIDEEHLRIVQQADQEMDIYYLTTGDDRAITRDLLESYTDTPDDDPIRGRLNYNIRRWLTEEHPQTHYTGSIDDEAE